MELLWFYVAIVLAMSDELHTILMWKIFDDFYIVFGGLLKETFDSNIQTWLIHEGLESAFHFIILSIVFLSPIIGILGALVHFTIDAVHSLKMKNMNWLEHRSLHFVIESIFFILIFGLGI
ncbi:MAG: hypothetical protein ACRCVG_04170 [Methanobacteriaceae archaeon]